LDTEHAADRLRHVDLIALALVAGSGAEQWIKVTHPDTDALGAQDLDQPVGAGLRARAGQSGARLLKQLGECCVRRAGSLGMKRRTEDQQNEKDQEPQDDRTAMHQPIVPAAPISMMWTSAKA